MKDKFSPETAQKRTYRAFKMLIADAGDDFDLARAALLIASIAYPDLDMAKPLAHLDALAQRVKAILSLPEYSQFAHSPQQMEPLLLLEILNSVIFDEAGFHGNREDYYHPDNSCLNRVLESHSGIPISLSVMYIEVARRVGITIEGIGLPYHFVVRYRHAQGLFYIDSFEGGTIMDEQACRERVQHLVQHKVQMHSRWFEPVSKRQILVRMLNNLKRNYINQDRFEQALEACNLLLLLTPYSAPTLRERGLLYLQLKLYVRSLRDLSAYLELAPDNEDRYEIKKQLKSLREIIAMMN